MNFDNLLEKEVEIDAIAPQVISASRSTDIPAFYPEWFMRRLLEGYTVWINPFNQEPQVISFQKTRMIVFWTKNPRPLMKYLGEISRMGINYYFQFTLNDYEEEKLEPNVPPLAKRIETFKELSDKIGKDKVIWRFDPLLLSPSLTIDQLAGKIKRIGDEVAPYTQKLVISFADINCYKKVKGNLDREGFSDYRELTRDEICDIANRIMVFNQQWNLSVSTCCESIDLRAMGIEHNKCVDGCLMKRLFPDDLKLIEFLKTSNVKDTGQRKYCGCIASKDIGQYNTCMHKCMYCYANHSQKTVENNFTKHKENPSSPTINADERWIEKIVAKARKNPTLNRFNKDS
ncbi:DUF1848 domain-containing protein [Methanoculleus taiwanensis]|uniref:DUF1848 domain-containing protein n=1 Tax=Methanoculleus taiwanensis TaxID=1550565 RepID=UPI001F501E26|nr:DUF1848 domain-containing protein [Methanoculleus taiwanensis]